MPSFEWPEPRENGKESPISPLFSLFLMEFGCMSCWQDIDWEILVWQLVRCSSPKYSLRLLAFRKVAGTFRCVITNAFSSLTHSN